MRRVAALLIVISACSREDDASPGVPANELCPALVQAFCDRETTCGTFPDRATCDTAASDAFDGCLLAVNGVAMWEAAYDGKEAEELVTAVGMGACGDALPSYVTQFEVFKPKLEQGAVCHSDVSCKPGLWCDDVTTTAPQGVCAPLQGSP
jgi:hypothetical protein